MSRYPNGYEKIVNGRTIEYRIPGDTRHFTNTWEDCPENTVCLVAFSGSVIFNNGHRIGKPAYYQCTSSNSNLRIHFYERGHYHYTHDEDNTNAKTNAKQKPNGSSK